MPLKHQMEEMPALNLTSMIDVLLVLIIFFLVGSRFVEEERQIELKLPQVKPGTALSAAPEKKIVNVYSDGHITLDHNDVTLEQLADRLSSVRSQYKALGVLVRGDASTTFQRIANVLNACKQAGVADLAISVETAGTEPNHARR